MRKPILLVSVDPRDRRCRWRLKPILQQALGSSVTLKPAGPLLLVYAGLEPDEAARRLRVLDVDCVLRVIPVHDLLPDDLSAVAEAAARLVEERVPGDASLAVRVEGRVGGASRMEATLRIADSLPQRRVDLSCPDYIVLVKPISLDRWGRERVIALSVVERSLYYSRDGSRYRRCGEE